MEVVTCPAADSTAEAAELTLLSPRNYQVFQRRSRLRGQIMVSGRAGASCERIETRVTGRSLGENLPGKWTALPLIGQTGGFAAEVPVDAGGWYRLEVRALKADQVVAQATVEKVGVGEVFVTAGQSNSTNSGEERTKPISGMVATFSGSDWRIADDPQPGVHDDGTGGSPWPSFGDAMYQKYRVPIGVAATGHGGTQAAQWQPGGELFEWMMTRIHQLGPLGFRAVLWHQGESDFTTPAEEYYRLIANLIASSKAAAGWEFPWFVAQVSYHPDVSRIEVISPALRETQKRLWDRGIALEGPDTDTLLGDHRDSTEVHFTAKGLLAHGQMWAEKVSIYLDRALTAD